MFPCSFLDPSKYRLCYCSWLSTADGQNPSLSILRGHIIPWLRLVTRRVGGFSNWVKSRLISILKGIFIGVMVLISLENNYLLHERPRLFSLLVLRVQADMVIRVLLALLGERDRARSKNEMA